MTDLADRPDPECLSFDQLIDECHALRRIIAGLAPSRLDPARLSPMESALFLALADRSGAILSAAELRAGARDRLQGAATAGSVSVHLSRLRHKLTGTGLAIVNAWGRGWYLEGNADVARRTAAKIQAGGRAASAAVGGGDRPGRAAGARAAR